MNTNMKLTIPKDLLPGETYIDNVYVSPYLPGNQSTPKSDVIRYLKGTDIIFPGLITCSKDKDCQADVSISVNEKRELIEKPSPHWNDGGHNHYMVSSQYGPSLLIAKTFLLLDNLLRFGINYDRVVKTRLLFSSSINQYRSWYYLKPEVEVVEDYNIEDYNDKISFIEEDNFLRSYYKVLFDDVYAYPKNVDDDCYEKYSRQLFKVKGKIYLIIDNGEFIKSKWSYKLKSYVYDSRSKIFKNISTSEMENIILENDSKICLVEKSKISKTLSDLVWKEERKKS